VFYSPLSFVGPKIALKFFLSKTPKIASSDFETTHVSEPYACTGLIKVLYNFILFFMDKNWHNINRMAKCKSMRLAWYVASHEEEEKCVQSADRNTWKKETTGKT